jgi:rhomboid family GlyGly-CTERM serine protease
VAQGDRGRAWVALALALAAAAVAGGWLPAGAIDYDVQRNLGQPWRWWTPVAVHLSALHLGANVAGALAVALVGWAGRVPARTAVAWGIAWPLTHLLLQVQPELVRYGGLSGVLHAGVAVLGLHLLLRPGAGEPDAALHRRRRVVGLGLLVVLCLKVASEEPFGPAVRAVEGWDIAVAPVAHACGAAAGLLAAILVEAVAAGRDRRHRAAATLRT